MFVDCTDRYRWYHTCMYICTVQYFVSTADQFLAYHQRLERMCLSSEQRIRSMYVGLLTLGFHHIHPLQRLGRQVRQRAEGGN